MLQLSTQGTNSFRLHNKTGHIWAERGKSSEDNSDLLWLKRYSIEELQESRSHNCISILLLGK